MIDDESEIANIFNEYFVNIVKKLGILTEEQTRYSATNQLSEVKMAVIKYKNHTRIKPSQHFNVGSTLFQRCGSTLKWRWFDVENETKSNVGFSTLHNVDTTSVSDVETTLKQRWYNFILTLLQCVLNISKSYIKTSQASDKHEFINL